MRTSGERYVLDASAILAWVHREPGGSLVRSARRTSAVSAVNWSEVAQKAAQRGVNVARRRAVLEGVGLVIVPFGADDAETVAALWAEARHLSLADRACLALGRRLDLPVLTADRAWRDLSLGVDVRLIR